MSPKSPDLIAEAIAHAAEFLIDACPSDATRITRGPDGEHGAIFVLKDPDHVEEFTRLYFELFSESTEERVDVNAVACNVPPDLESN